MNTLHDILFALLAAALVGYLALAVSACGTRVAPIPPEGKVHSSGRY